MNTKPFHEYDIDFNDGRTSWLERLLVWFTVVCMLTATISEVIQGLAVLGLL